MRGESTDMHRADLKLSNIMLSVGDESIFEDYEEAEASSPSQSRMFDNSRRVYASRLLRKPQNHAYGDPLLCDFGEAA